MTKEEPLTDIRLSYARLGDSSYHEYDSANLGTLVQHLVELGSVAPIGSPLEDRRLRETDFLPSEGVLVDEKRVCVTWNILERLAPPDREVKELVDLYGFLELACFGGFVVTRVPRRQRRLIRLRTGRQPQ